MPQLIVSFITLFDSCSELHRLKITDMDNITDNELPGCLKFISCLVHQRRITIELSCYSEEDYKKGRMRWKSEAMDQVLKEIEEKKGLTFTIKLIRECELYFSLFRKFW